MLKYNRHLLCTLDERYNWNCIRKNFFYMRCQGNNDCTVCKYFLQFLICNLSCIKHHSKIFIQWMFFFIFSMHGTFWNHWMGILPLNKSMGTEGTDSKFHLLSSEWIVNMRWNIICCFSFLLQLCIIQNCGWK